MKAAFKQHWAVFKLAFLLIGLAVAFPVIASVLLLIDVGWVQQVALGFEVLAYFGSFLLIMAGTVVLSIAFGLMVYSLIRNRPKAQ